jgi:hypothetical protein
MLQGLFFVRNGFVLSTLEYMYMLTSLFQCSNWLYQQ